VDAVYYLHDWVHPDPHYQAEYERLQSRFTGGIRPLALDDPDAAWAITSRRAEAGRPDEIGHG
jgi:dCMP deaminase